MTTHDRPAHGGYPGAVRTTTPLPNGAFWMPDESGEGGEWMTPGQVFRDPDARRWFIVINRYQTRIATPAEIDRHLNKKRVDY